MVVLFVIDDEDVGGALLLLPCCVEVLVDEEEPLCLPNKQSNRIDVRTLYLIAAISAVIRPLRTASTAFIKIT